MKSLSRVRLFATPWTTLCDPVDCSPPGSSIHGILQVRILEWVAISFSRGSSGSRDQTPVSRTSGRRFNALYNSLYKYKKRSLVVQMVKNLPAMQETWVQFLSQEDPLEKGMANHSSILNLANSMNRGAWQATVHGVTKSWTQLSD